MLWCALMLVVCLLVGCTQEAPPPPVPPPPEDLSTWSVPELVQPPSAPLPAPPPPPEEKATAVEQVLTFTPGTTVTLTVPSDVPLDLVLERGEQVRNIVGGDRAPVEPNQPPRWEVKEGA